MTIIIPKILYSSGYRFVLEKPYTVTVEITGKEVHLQFVTLSAAGELTIAAGYAWDGASGPVQQSPDVIRPSLVHDVLYQLMREGHIDKSYRDYADRLLRTMCIEDGSPSWHAENIYKAVRAFGAKFIAPDSTHPILRAPVPVVYPSAGEQEAP